MQCTAGDRRKEADTLNALGNLYIARPQPAKALEYLTQAETLWGLRSAPARDNPAPSDGRADAKPRYTPRAHRGSETRREFQRQHFCPATGKTSGACPGYVRDHVVPVACGGPDSPA